MWTWQNKAKSVRLIKGLSRTEWFAFPNRPSRPKTISIPGAMGENRNPHTVSTVSRGTGALIVLSSVEMCWSFYLNEQVFGADKHVPGRYQSRNSALAGKGVVEESLIEALYCFHQNNECSKCEVVHTQRRPP